MDYEKKYKEALEKIREGFQPLPDGAKISGVTRAFLEEVFPELQESEDEKIRKVLVELVKCNERCGYFMINNITTSAMLAWLEKQGDCSIKWNKNTEDNKPQVNHSVLIQTSNGIAEGEWKGDCWFQYRWSCSLKDSNVLYWAELSDVEKQGEQKPQRLISAEAKEAMYDKPAWSEEDDDDAWMNDIISKVENNLQLNKAEIGWLKSLKQRIGGEQ